MGDRACWLDFCPSCDAQVTVVDDECPDCGKELEGTDASQERRTPGSE
ncbi:hypothetical protein [Halobacterium bonnevillei]|nr:hypothetical protein [Halobacterium bonnevillei]